MPHRNRIALKHHERMIRAFEDDNEWLLACSAHLCSQQINCKRNRPFYRYGGHIEFILRFKKYYGMPRGALAQYLRALFGQKENFAWFLGKKAIIITSRHGITIFFSHYNLFIGKFQTPKVWPRRNAGHFPPIPLSFPFLPNAFRNQLRRLQADEPVKTFLCSCYSLYSNHLYGVTPLFSIVQFVLDMFNKLMLLHSQRRTRHYVYSLY